MNSHENVPQGDHRPVLIAFDGSDHALAAVSEAARLFPGRPAVVVSGWRSIEAAVSASLIAVSSNVADGAKENIDAASEHDAIARAEEGVAVAAAAGMEAEAWSLKAGGVMWRAIMTSADAHDAAAVVVGSRGFAGVRSALLGSTSTGLIHHCTRPVLVVHAPASSGEPS